MAPFTREVDVPVVWCSMDALQLLRGLPEEMEYLVLAFLVEDRRVASAFSLTCKKNTKFVRDIAFWRLAVRSQRRQIPAEVVAEKDNADSIRSLASFFYKRVYAEDFQEEQRVLRDGPYLFCREVSSGSF